MDLSIVILLIAMAFGVGLCVGYLLGHQAAYERSKRRGLAARRFTEATSEGRQLGLRGRF